MNPLFKMMKNQSGKRIILSVIILMKFFLVW